MGVTARAHLLIAFLWFIGVVRDQLGGVKDCLFSTVFLGSRMLFVAMLFVGAGTSASLMATLAGTSVNADAYAFGRATSRSLFSVHAMRMAAVFTLAMSTVGIRILFRPPTQPRPPSRTGELSTYLPTHLPT